MTTAAAATTTAFEFVGYIKNPDNLPIVAGVGAGAGVLLLLIICLIVCCIVRRNRDEEERSLPVSVLFCFVLCVLRLQNNQTFSNLK